MAGEPSPAIRRRELGARLRGHRQAAGLTVEEVAGRLMISAPKMSRIETAQRGVNLRDVRDLAALYRLPPEEVEALLQLARDSRQRSSWEQYSNQISDYAQLEEAAVEIWDYESSLIPALLQSERYGLALAAGTAPGSSLEERRKAVEARMARQASLRERRPRVETVIDEAALHRVVGGAETMSEQMQVVLDRAGEPNITVQVIPFEAGAHPGMDSTFIILGFEESMSDLVYVEGLVGSLYLKAPSDTARYRRTFQHLQTVALSPERSLDKIRSHAEDAAS